MKILKLNKKKVFVFLVTFFVLILFLKYNFNKCKNCTPLNYVYSYYKTNLEFKLFCKLPKNINHLISIEKVEKRGDFEILCLKDKRFSAIKTYYFLKQNEDFLILKNPNLDTKSTNVNSINYNNFIINYDAFNKCTIVFWNHKKNNIDYVLNKFCFFLSDYYEDDSVIEIQSINDIGKLSKKYKIPNLKQVIFNQKKILINKENSKSLCKFYWFKEKGFLKISFVRNNFSKAIEVISVESLGYFGNEHFAL